MSDAEPSRQVPVTVMVNGREVSRTVPARLLLVHFLRRDLQLTGTHVGCDTTQCGACTVELDGVAVKSCTVLTVQADGGSITTIEGIGDDRPGGSDGLDAVQRGFWERHGLQCGYCTPGMVMAVRQLLRDTPDPTEEQVRHGLDGNLCRCTGYQNIVDAALHAAAARAAAGG